VAGPPLGFGFVRALGIRLLGILGTGEHGDDQVDQPQHEHGSPGEARGVATAALPGLHLDPRPLDRLGFGFGMGLGFGLRFEKSDACCSRSSRIARSFGPISRPISASWV